MNILGNVSVTTLYLVLLGVGLVYAFFLLLTGQLGGDVDGGGGIDLSAHGEVDLHAAMGDVQHGISPISPLTIATFVSAFGATGLVALHVFSVSDRLSILWASLGGVCFSALVYVGFTYLFIKPQGSSEVQTAELIGRIAEVITPIPENGMGEIATVAQGGRITYSARSQSKAAVDRGTPVRIVRIVGGVAYIDIQLGEEEPRGGTPTA